MEKQQKTISRYEIRGKVKGWAFVTFVLCVILYIVFDFVIIPGADMTTGLGRFLTTLKNVVVVVMSIVGTSLITGFLIDKKDRNEVFTDAILDELVFPASNHEAAQRELLHRLERGFYFKGNEKKREIFQSVMDQSDTALQGYYSTRSTNRIICTVTEEYIKKEISIESWLFSYDETTEIENFSFVTNVSKNVDDVTKLEISEIVINGKKLKANDFEILEKEVETTIDQKNDYSIIRICRYKHPLELKQNTPTKVSVRYQTTVPPDDFTYCIRAKCPSLDFTVDFRVSGNQKYDLRTHAFGFCEDAMDTPNVITDLHSVFVRFANWIFYKDGVCISFSPLPKS